MGFVSMGGRGPTAYAPYGAGCGGGYAAIPAWTEGGPDIAAGISTFSAFATASVTSEITFGLTDLPFRDRPFDRWCDLPDFRRVTTFREYSPDA